MQGYERSLETTLVLTLENADSLEPGIERFCRVTTGPTSIGRGKTANWQLPDRSRFLSSVHCVVARNERGYQIADRSRNGITLNGKAIGKGESAPLLVGDRIGIGPYTIAVQALEEIPSAAEQRSDPDKTVFRPMPHITAGGDKTAVPPGAADRTVIAPRHGRIVHDDKWQVDPVLKEGLQGLSKPREKTAHKKRARTVPSSEFITRFAEGAGIDPEALAGRSDGEFAQELGEILSAAIPRLMALSQSVHRMRELAGIEDIAAAEGGQINLLYGEEGNAKTTMTALLSRAEGDALPAVQSISDTLDEFASHEKALFAAMQSALFRLLNALAPTTIEAQTGTGLLRTKKAANWDAYAALWEELSGAGENGMLDILLAYFREEYERRLRGL